MSHEQAIYAQKYAIMQEKINFLEIENARYKAALIFYADDNNYNGDFGGGIIGSKIECDDGHKARQALGTESEGG